jgi:hypothetical protein
MPFDPAFKDIYKFGIKGAAEDVGAYAERLDEQMFDEGMLDRIFNQISKADVVVADMTGRNANVFYEVGYAHALNKVVLLLTQEAEDIPFDLKHRPHIVYAGDIEKLRLELGKRLTWAVEESLSRSRQLASAFDLAVFVLDQRLREIAAGPPFPRCEKKLPPDYGYGFFRLRFDLRNGAARPSEPVSHLYLFTPADSHLSPVSVRDVVRRDGDSITSDQEVEPFTLFSADPADEARLGLGRQYRFPSGVPTIPAGAVEVVQFGFRLGEGYYRPGQWKSEQVALCLRLHTTSGQRDFPFELIIEVPPPSPTV